MYHEHRVKQQIHYDDLRNQVKENYGKQFATVTTHKNVQKYYN